MNKVVSIVLVMLLGFGASTVLAAEKPAPTETAKSAMVVERVNINSADADALASGLHRVGPKTAQSIVEWRAAHGKFTSKEQLMEVKGIGEAVLKANNDRIVL